MWGDIQNSRKKIEDFAHRSQEYQRVLETIFSSFEQFKSCIEQIEELWLYFQEEIYQKRLEGRFTFDALSKKLFQKKVLENRFIRAFLEEVTEQVKLIQEYPHKTKVLPVEIQANQVVLGDMCDKLEKLSINLNQEYMSEDLIKQCYPGTQTITEPQFQELLQFQY